MDTKLTIERGIAGKHVGTVTADTKDGEIVISLWGPSYHSGTIKITPEELDQLIDYLVNVKTVYQEETKFQQRPITINVNRRPFRCDCGSNQFTEYESKRYSCNVCGAQYRGEDE